jgi:hypothetical protein
MGHKVKIRVTLNSGKVEKIGFTLDEGKIFRLNGEVPGMAILASLVGDPETTVCRMTIKGDALVVSRSTKGPELVVNQVTVEEIKIRKGDICKYENGTVEFLECPVWVEQEQSTKFVSLDSSDATAVMQNPNKTKFISTPVKEDERTQVGASHQSIHEPAPADAQDQSAEVAQPAEDYSSAASSDQSHDQHHDTYEDVQDGATGLIMRSAVTADPGRRKTQRRLDEPSYSTLYTNGDTEISNVKKELYKHIAISLAIIGVCGEVSSLIAFGFKYDFSPIPTPYSGMMLMAAFSAISYVFFMANKFLGSNGRFEQYLRTFAWFALYLVPYAFCFGFPKSVIIFASALISIIWTGLFSLRYFGQIPKFIPASIGTWVVIIVSGFHVLTTMTIPTIHSQAVREIASDKTDGDAEEKGPNLTAQAAPDAQVAVAPAPVAPAGGPQVAAPAAPQVAAAPLTTQELAQQATSLSLDPMAQERFFNAVKSGNLNMVQSMVERRVIDPVFTLDHGSTALHYAASQGDIRMVAYLTSKKVNIDAQDSGGTTALMWAAYKHHPKVVAFLIKRKANLQIRREGGDRAIEIARSTDDKEIVGLLKDAMKVRKVASVTAKKKRR